MKPNMLTCILHEGRAGEELVQPLDDLLAEQAAEDLPALKHLHFGPELIDAPGQGRRPDVVGVQL